MFLKYTSGRPTNPAQAAVSLMRYIPKSRRPWLPHEFYRANLEETELGKMWDHSRFNEGPGEPWGGYAKMKEYNLRGIEKLNLVTKAELERFMPDISISNKAAVTPVSLMSARGGHRVTHDLLHSYDPLTTAYLTQSKPVDHDNITVEDPNRVGLHPNSFGCRTAIFRWLRRGPFSDEIHYRDRYVLKKGAPIESDAEKPLIKKVIRLAKSGQLKAACEEYRRFVFYPPVEVYRALLAACVPQGLIGDAVSIYEEGNVLNYASRDFECLRSLMRTAIEAQNTVRVMWAFDLVVGYWAHTVSRTQIEPIHANQIFRLALEYLLDRGLQTEARTVYAHMAAQGLLEYDLYERAGVQLREAILKGETVNIPSDWAAGVSTEKDAVEVTGDCAALWFKRLSPADQNAIAGSSSSSSSSPSAAVQRDHFERAFSDVDIRFVLRAARFHGERDLLSSDAGLATFTDRALGWLEQLSSFRLRAADAEALPYLLKSTATAGGPQRVRVVASPSEVRAIGRLSPTERGHSFWYSAQGTRFVEQTYPTMNVDSNARKYLVRDPVQREVPVAIADFKQDHLAAEAARQRRPTRLVHESVRELSSSYAATPSAASSTGALGDAGKPHVEQISADKFE